MTNIHSANKLPLRIEGIQPILSVKNMTISRNFYINIVGFREVDWGDDTFTCIYRDKASIYLCKGGQGNPGTWLWLGFDGDIFVLHGGGRYYPAATSQLLMGFGDAGGRPR